MLLRQVESYSVRSGAQKTGLVFLQVLCYVVKAKLKSEGRNVLYTLGLCLHADTTW
jgi:hypothetical protein